jgi:bla regulator protein BlaR1
MIKNLKKSTKRVCALSAVCLVLSGAGVLVGTKVYASSSTAIESKIQDKIDYPFFDDSEAVGKWEVVDFVEKVDNFKPGEKQWRGEDFLRSMTILSDGKMAPFEVKGRETSKVSPLTSVTWTKGYILDSQDKTASQYTIKEINGTKYMFMEWKSGDYTLRGMTPWYYVFKAIK